MKSLCLTVLTAALLLIGVAAEIKNLHVKFAAWDGFYSIPLTVGEVQKSSSGFVFVTQDSDLNVDLYSYPGDPRFFLLYGTNGDLVGLRTGYIKADVANRAHSKNLTFSYNFDGQPMYTSGNYWNTSLWYTTVLFTNPESLKAGLRETVDAEVYLPLDGQWTKIPKDECKVEALGFTKQACFIGMGMHYFYKMTKDADCADLPGVFTLYESGQLIGIGIIPFGSFTSKSKTWFEDPPASVVKDIVPNRPACLIDWLSNYGTTSMHIFFKRFPRLTFCVWPWQKSDRCSKE